MAKPKYDRKKVFIVIAAYNEGKSILNVITNLKHGGYDNIVVVDDGSKDDTYDILLKEDVYALRHIINRGQGAALKTGIDFAMQQGADIIVTFDADGQHRVQDIEPMIRPVIKGECEITFGSRFLRKVDMPFFRRLTLKIAIMVVWLFYGVKMSDAHNGFRAFSRIAAQRIDITSDRMEHASQIIEEVHRKRIKYEEIPVVILYSDYSLEHGHGSFRQALKIFGTMMFRKLVK